MMGKDASNPDAPAATTRKGGIPWKPILIVSAIVLLLGAAKLFHAGDKLKAALDWIEQLGFWGPLIFILLYIVATVFFLPGSVLTLGAGAVFGLGWGCLYVSIGSTLGATAAFVAGRYFARGWVERKIAGNDKFAAIDQAVGREGWKIVGLTRLSPVFPFNLLNYAFSMTNVPLGHYFLATWIGMIPGTVMWVYIGSLAKTAAGEATAVQWTIRIVGLAVAVAVTVYVTRIARKALKQKLS